MSIKLNVLKVSQNTKKGQAIYIASVPVGNLIDEAYFKIHWWKKEKMGTKDQGYQRVPMEGRKRKIAKYLETYSHPIIPNSILISSRDNILEFKPKTGNFGELTVEPYPCFIVDGQTRVEGFKHAKKEFKLNIDEFEMPVIFLSGYPLIEELEQFFILNSSQKRVSTDLAQRLKLELAKNDQKKFEDLGVGEMWELKALKLIDLLNQKNDSLVWNGRIRLPNTQKSPINIINQNSFIKSLRPLYKGGVFENIKLDSAYEMLKNYWEALRFIYVDAFSKPKEYVIQKTPGVFSLHDLANLVFKNIMLQQKEYSKSNMVEILDQAFKDNQKKDYYWHSDNYLGAAAAGSMKGFVRLANSFKSNLDEIQI